MFNAAYPKCEHVEDRFFADAEGLRMTANESVTYLC